MIQIILNGKPHNIKEKTNIISLLEALSLSEKKVAIEINEEVLPRDNYAKKILSDKDRVEIVHFIGGG
ncbi:ThiS Sulfur transfer protein involved in thiamine biosynthesis [Candidatus Pelagibacterales bacterium]